MRGFTAHTVHSVTNCAYSYAAFTALVVRCLITIAIFNDVRETGQSPIAEINFWDFFSLFIDTFNFWE